MNGVVIIGTGLAGYSVARELRKRNKEVPLLIVTADDGHFYSKPGLSEALRGGLSPAQLVAKTAAQMSAQVAGTVRTDAPVAGLDTGAREVLIGDERIGYRQLVFAVGADPVRVPFPDAAAERVFCVNDLTGYRRFREATGDAKRIAILGAGLIGCEFANDHVQAGYAVDVIDVAPQALPRLLPPSSARLLEGALRAAGVRWHLGTTVATIERDASGLTVHCANGDTFDTDIVLCAVGLRPRTALAQAAGIRTGRAIVVDGSLRTSAPDVFALGDCADVAGQWQPYVAPILHAARTVAAALDGHAATVRYPAMPIVVKTPVCPTVVCPPPAGVEGEWTMESDADGIRSLFRDNAGGLRGFALQGAHAAQARTLAQQLPMWLE